MEQSLNTKTSFFILIGLIAGLYPLLLVWTSLFGMFVPNSYSFIPLLNILLFLIPYILMGNVIKIFKIHLRGKKGLSILIPIIFLISERLVIFLLAVNTFITMQFDFIQYSGTNIIDSTYNMLSREAGLGSFYFFILPFVNLLIVNLIVHKPFKFKLVLEKFSVK